MSSADGSVHPRSKAAFEEQLERIDALRRRNLRLRARLTLRLREPRDGGAR